MKIATATGLVSSEPKIAGPLALLCLVLVTGCGSGPTKRTVDGDWKVSENICSSDPANPEKGDLRSEFRTKSNDSTSAKRVVNFYHLDKTILNVNNSFNRSGMTGTLTIYENSPENAVKETRQARSLNEINDGMRDAVVEFFDDDPTVDGSKVLSFCLFRGQ